MVKWKINSIAFEKYELVELRAYSISAQAEYHSDRCNMYSFIIHLLVFSMTVFLAISHGTSIHGRVYFL